MAAPGTTTHVLEVAARLAKVAAAHASAIVQTAAEAAPVPDAAPVAQVTR